MNKSDLLEKLSLALRIPIAQLEKMLNNAPYRYRHYQIKKRTGGWRDIYQPTASLKEVQRWLIRECFASLPVSDAVFSYRAGLGIKDHALAHLESNYFLRLDFTDFFPSIGGAELFLYLKKMRSLGKITLDDEALIFSINCLCRKKDDTYGLKGLSLTIGAPSSPYLSNSIIYEFDEFMLKAASDSGSIYTRYADDIYISSKQLWPSQKMEEKARLSLNRYAPFLNINESKVRRFSRKRRVNICGINITSKRSISVGREVKKLIRAKIDYAINDRLNKKELDSLRGWLSYVESIEPGYILKNSQRVGIDLFEQKVNRKIIF